jgi:hypothetical protein
MQRNRILNFVLIISTIIVGLAARRFSDYLPDLINLGLGDALWALMIYWIMGFLFPTFSIQKLALISLILCFLVEFSQLYQADWINAIRNNRFGHLVLGKGFLWTDFIAYTIGVGCGVGLEYAIRK